MSQNANPATLETALEAAGGAVPLLRSSKLGYFPFPHTPSEFTNWRDEARSWANDVALLELSHHMTELHFRGPGVIDFLEHIALNKFAPFPIGRAKQIVLGAPDGNLIGDGIISHEAPDFYRIIGLPPTADDWVHFNLEQNDHAFTVELNERGSWPRDVFRIQIQGPKALTLVTEVAGGNLPEIPFFAIGDIRIAGKSVHALRHGMAGAAGFELTGAWDDQWAVREALEVAGEKYGLRKVGDLAYRITAQESGWFPQTLPAIYTHASFKAFREWLPGDCFEATASLGGSYDSPNIEDYYVNPVELGYGLVVDWNRNFIGRDALREKADNPRRKKVTLEWNNDDVAGVFTSALFGPERGGLYPAFPNLLHAVFEYDIVLDKDGRPVGTSQWASYTPNARRVISSALVDIADAEPGTELTLLWGEPNSKRPRIEANELRDIRVTVQPSPYFEKVIKSGKQ
ncbi:hypothetical protein [Nocardia sp. R6R-6]|uniref:hypothetical protein n=1 Tax=Nocardia sp. R6R-6 TaxID=3459303 RepID=UPI00403D64F3